MDDQLFQVIMAGAGVLISIIGFFLAYTLKGIQTRISNHGDRLDDQDERIDQNTMDIKVNTERDKLIRESIDINMAELKTSMKELGARFETHTATLQEVLLNLKSKTRR